MANKPREYWVVELDLGSRDVVYLRKNYWTVFMHDIQFSELFSSEKQAKSLINQLNHAISSNPKPFIIAIDGTTDKHHNYILIDTLSMKPKQIAFTVI